MILRGVNLGGWLVLERWITPSVFDGLKAQDEYSFCIEANDSHASLKEHRQNFITEDDFKWLAQHGINALRIPVPHWIFGSYEPYVAGAEYLDKAMDWALKYKLKVIIDIHTAPRSQNGQMHSGRAGPINWHKHKQNVQASLDLLKQLCQRYGKFSCLYGIELLNEPRAWINPLTLRSYYNKGYEIVRQHCGEHIAVVISDYYAPWRWRKFMPEPAFRNVIRDTHLYQCHRTADKKLSLDQHISKANNEWKKLITKSQKDKPLIIGEWSLALAAETFLGMSETDKISGLKAYASAQINVFDTTGGWFYWTYKTEEDDLWNFRYCFGGGLVTT